MNEEELAASPHLQEYPTFVELYYIILYYIVILFIYSKSLNLFLTVLIVIILQIFKTGFN